MHCNLCEFCGRPKMYVLYFSQWQWDRVTRPLCVSEITITSEDFLFCAIAYNVLIIIVIAKWGSRRQIQEPPIDYGVIPEKISLTGTNRLITPGISVTLDIRHFHVRSLVIQTTVHQTGITHFPDISVAHRFLSRVLSRLSVLFLSCADLNLLSVSFWASVYHVRQYGIATSVFCTPMNENTFHCKLSSCVVSLNFSVAC